MWSRIDYSAIADRFASVHDSGDDFAGEFDRHPRKRRGSQTHWIVHALSLVTIIGLLILLQKTSSTSRQACWDMYNYYSPANEALAQHSYIETRFNGSLWYQSPFKGPPSSEVEAAWHSVMKYGMIAVTASDLERVGHSLRTAVKFPDASGGGYVAATVGTHQLHCLHYIWQDHHSASFPEVQRKMDEIPEMYERHYEHCIDYIRQSLMCHFDLGLVTYDWVLKHPNPTPNSNAMHKCADWGKAQEWLKGRAVEVPDGFVWSQPPGQESLEWNP